MFLYSGSPKKKVGIMEFSELLKRAPKDMVVRTDSRKVQDGDCFVALPGTTVQGIDYIPNALENGAQYIVVPEVARNRVAPIIGDRAVAIYHANPAVALGELARAHFQRPDQDVKVVGITGTNGKTTTSYITEHLLASVGLKVGVIGTVNYRWPGFEIEASLTTPDCWMLHELIANMKKADVDVALMETSSHALEQFRVAGLDFTAGVFTNLTQDHLDYHGDMETYFRAKSKLFTDYLADKKAQVINYNDPYGRILLKENPDSIGYGIGDTSVIQQEVGERPMLQGRIVSINGQGIELESTYKGKTWTVKSPLIGAFNAMNILAAQAVCLQLGLGWKEMRALEDFPGVPGRLERVMNDHGLDVFVDFAHTPDALENVQQTLKALNFKRLITLFGCGGDRDRTKRPLMGQAVARYADVAILTSDNPRSEEPIHIMDDVRPGLSGVKQIIEHPDRRTAIELAVREMQPGDVLLIAGRGHEPKQKIKGEMLPFLDTKVTAEVIEEVYS